MSRATRADEALAMIGSDASKVLQMALGNRPPIQPGDYFPRADAREAPQLTFAGSGMYLIVCLDLDAPFVGFPVLGPILHWVQAGLKSADGALRAEVAATCDYAPPGPPPFSGPHRYVFMLYDQPADFDVSLLGPAGQHVGPAARMRFDYEAFEKRAKLGPVLAANYFTSN